MEQQAELSFFKRWWISSRPFSFSASTMPVIFGTVAAAVYGGYSFDLYHFALFLLAFTGMVVLHAGANILSDIFDFGKGLDTVPNPVSGGVVRGIITKKEAKTAAYLMFAIGTAIGLLLVYLTGIWLLMIGLVGLFVGYFYTSNHAVALKYNGLGDLAVFLDFGILGSLGAWYVQTGTLSWIPVIWVVPMSLLVIGILHANNWRDIQSDKEIGIFTVASVLGDKGSLRYYWFLLFVPFILILLMIFIPRIIPMDFPAMPYTFLFTLLALPLAINLWKKALRRKTPKDPLEWLALDGATAQFNMAFGLLCTIALLLQAAMNYYA